MLLNEYEIEFMFRKIRNIRNLGNVHVRGPHTVMSRLAEPMRRTDLTSTLNSKRAKHKLKHHLISLEIIYGVHFLKTW
jgi:hypothetical protein